MVAGSNWVRGCAGFRTIFVRDTCWMSPCRGSGAGPPPGNAEGGAIGTSRSTAVGIRASSPRPNAFLTTLDHLPRQIDVARRSGASRIVDDHRLPEAWRFAEPHVARDHGSIDPLRKKAPRLLEHLLREIEAIVVHRQKNALDLERWIETLLHEPDRAEELRQSLEGVVLALHRDENRLGTREGVHREKAERRWRVDDDEVETILDPRQRFFETELSALHVDELDFGGGETLAGRDKAEPGHFGFEKHVLDREVGRQDLVDPAADLDGRMAETAPGISLGIEIDE